MATNSKQQVTTLQDEREKRIRALISEARITINRTALASRGSGGLGKSFFPESGGSAERDVYKALGFTKNIQFTDYLDKYRRSEVGRRVVDAMPEACWRKEPQIYEVGNETGDLTPFDQAWTDLLREMRVFHYMARADKLSGVGWFGILLLGYDDVKSVNDLAKEVDAAEGRKLLYLRPYMAGESAIDKWEDDPKSPRYGMPKVYKVKARNAKVKGGGDKDTELRIHHSRIVHIAEGLADNDVWGTPRLECVYNHLESLEYVVGGGAEMFWRGAFPGYALQAQEGASFDAQAMDDLEDEIQSFLHDLQRYIRVEGIDVNPLDTQVESPKDHFDVLISVIACGAQMPKRILLGTERGELASSQDEKSWLDRVSIRRTNFCEPVIVRPTVQSLIDTKVLPEPAEGFEVWWPDLMTRSEKEQAEVAKAQAEAVAKYVSAPGAMELVPPSVFLGEVLGWDKDLLDKIEAELGRKLDGEKDDEEEE